jgi:hypothetical protein
MQQQIKATTRGETESTSVATNVAKDLAKHYAAMLKKSAETNMATPAGTQQQ